MKAYDFIRTIGWYVVDFIYTMIDTLFEYVKNNFYGKSK